MHHSLLSGMGLRFRKINRRGINDTVMRGYSIEERASQNTFISFIEEEHFWRKKSLALWYTNYFHWVDSYFQELWIFSVQQFSSKRIHYWLVIDLFPQKRIYYCLMNHDQQFGIFWNWPISNLHLPGKKDSSLTIDPSLRVLQNMFSRKSVRTTFFLRHVTCQNANRTCSARVPRAHVFPRALFLLRIFPTAIYHIGRCDGEKFDA